MIIRVPGETNPAMVAAMAAALPGDTIMSR